MMKYSDLRESTSKQYIAFRCIQLMYLALPRPEPKMVPLPANNVNNISPEACAPSWEFLLVTNDPATCENVWHAEQ